MQKLLLNELSPAGCWRGSLSSSALATALAVAALYKHDRQKYRKLIDQGIQWLSENVNNDGGWGDTPDSPTNFSTTLIVFSALKMLKISDSRLIDKADSRLQRHYLPENGDINSTLSVIYGSDMTFSAPILAFCAIAGSNGNNAWDKIPQLPFELVILPHSLLKILGIGVVSYALPALIAVGLSVLNNRKKTLQALSALLRRSIVPAALKKLERIQPENGGFLEAAPLTSFVLLNLNAAGHPDHIVCRKCADFLVQSCREDGSWPIDSDLATWLTTSAVKSLPETALNNSQKKSISRWLLDQQFKTFHPYTGSAPGGWSWTDLPGGVPDADDTAGALIALKKLACDDFEKQHIIPQVTAGINWLLQLQNNDGGFPTFCRGWGRLPFDRSCPDITAHTLQAIATWKNELPEKVQANCRNAAVKALQFLRNSQLKNGSWLPLWFGSQLNKHHNNPVFGTAKVLESLLCAGSNIPTLNTAQMQKKAIDFLRNSQHPNGSWGADKDIAPTIEETASAVCALTSADINRNPEPGKYSENIEKGIKWLREQFQKEQIAQASPIGLYFASLWYSEKLYPLIFATAAETNHSLCNDQ